MRTKLTASIPLYLDSTVQPSGERRWRSAIHLTLEMPVPSSAYRGCLQLQTIQLLRHNSPMNRFLPDPLTPEELTALKVVAAAPPLRGLPYRIVKRLIDLCFAETVRGGLKWSRGGLVRVRVGLNAHLRERHTIAR